MTSLFQNFGPVLRGGCFILRAGGSLTPECHGWIYDQAWWSVINVIEGLDWLPVKVLDDRCHMTPFQYLDIPGTHPLLRHSKPILTRIYDL